MALCGAWRSDERGIREAYSNNFYKIEGQCCTYREIRGQIFARFPSWFKFYSYEFLHSLVLNDKLYPEYCVFDDVLMHVKSIILARKIAILKEGLYYYRVWNGNITNGGYSRGEGVMDSFVFMRDVESFLLSQDLLKELRKEFCGFVTDSIHYHFKRVLPTHKGFL
ncbi:hypothetical protein [Helicobacter sp. MIT 05-5294]|uniref:hypothetical protein n=1 Tax=Helicobacter sp. MIT 05-5294 TaxID=1548150 RepID=UPI00051F93F7|nr:hypothetical protein [Helicobacter sp. MIT 05-5294]TLD85604.1 hypothetical protein LS69_008830 [Helicobacter sp. MIT 05-5294]